MERAKSALSPKHQCQSPPETLPTSCCSMQKFNKPSQLVLDSRNRDQFCPFPVNVGLPSRLGTLPQPALALPLSLAHARAHTQTHTHTRAHTQLVGVQSDLGRTWVGKVETEEPHGRRAGGPKRNRDRETEEQEKLDAR